MSEHKILKLGTKEKRAERYTEFEAALNDGYRIKTIARFASRKKPGVLVFMCRES